MPITKIDGKKKNGKQGYRVRVNFTDAYGKARQVERTVYGIEDAKEAEWQLNLSCKEATPSAITLETLSFRYFAAQKHEVRESTLSKNRCIFETHILPLLGENRIDKLNVKNRVMVLPNYTKQIKELLDLNKPKQSLIDTLIDTIIIDENRNISIKFKYDVIPKINFKYENRNLARNPYGRKGKNELNISN